MIEARRQQGNTNNAQPKHNIESKAYTTEHTHIHWRGETATNKKETRNKQTNKNTTQSTRNIGPNQQTGTHTHTLTREIDNNTNEARRQPNNTNTALHTQTRTKNQHTDRNTSTHTGKARSSHMRQRPEGNEPIRTLDSPLTWGLRPNTLVERDRYQ